MPHGFQDTLKTFITQYQGHGTVLKPLFTKAPNPEEPNGMIKPTLG